MVISDANTFAWGEWASCFSPYLYMGSLISPLQCFPFLFSQCHATNSSQICLCSEQQISSVWLFLSLGQPTVCFLFKLSASLPHCPQFLIVFAFVCPLLFIESKIAGEHRGRLELYYTHRWAAQEALVRSSERQKSFCHLCHSTFTHTECWIYSSSLINIFFCYATVKRWLCTLANSDMRF